MLPEREKQAGERKGTPPPEHLAVAPGSLRLSKSNLHKRGRKMHPRNNRNKLKPGRKAKIH